MARSRLLPILGAAVCIGHGMAQAHGAPAFEDGFNGAMAAGWTAVDGYAVQHPQDSTNHASIQTTPSHLSIAFPGGAEHNMWWLAHAEVTRSFPGSGVYEIKVDSALTGAQQFGLKFQGDDPGTFLIFMLYATDQVRAYVERFSDVAGQLHKYTFSGGSIGRYVPDAGPYYLRVSVDDHPLPTSRTWQFAWSADGANWTTLISGGLEGSAEYQNIGVIESVGVFAGNQPTTFDAFDGRFDYFRYYTPGTEPILPPSNLVARAGDQRVDLWWDEIEGADSYGVYKAASSGGPYDLLGISVAPSFVDLAALNGVAAHYVVTAFSAGTESDVSAEAVAVPHVLGDIASLPSGGLLLALSASELAYHLGDGDPVQQWPTAIGTQATAFGAGSRAPVFVSGALNGRPVVRFDGADDFLALSGNFDDFTAGVTLFVVARPTVLQSGFKLLALGNGPAKQNIVLGRAGSTPGLQYFTDSGFGSVGWFNTADGLVAGEPMLLSILQDAGPASSTRYAEVSKNGSALNGQAVYVPPVASRDLNFIGKSYWNEGMFQGDIAEVLLYDRKLASGELAAVYAYFAAKYGLGAGGSEPPVPLDAPSGVTAEVGDSTVTLAWANVAGALGYRVYRSQGDDGEQFMIADLPEPGYTDTAVVNGLTYHYTVTAYDVSEESPHSSVVHATPVEPQPPGEVVLPTDGLILSLAADTAAGEFQNNSPVTEWQDLSGHDNDAVAGAGAPTLVTSGINGKPVLRFDGVDDFLILPAGFEDFTAGITLYIVARPTVLQSGFKLLALGNGAAKQNIVLGRAGSTAGLQYFTDSGFGSVGWFNTSDGLVPGEAALLSVVQEGGPPSSTSSAEIGKNGVTLRESSVFVPPIAVRALNYIGKSYWNEGMFQGDIAEILLYDRILDSGEQAAVRSYVAEKYGLLLP